MRVNSTTTRRRSSDGLGAHASGLASITAGLAMTESPIGTQVEGMASRARRAATLRAASEETSAGGAASHCATMMADFTEMP